MAQEDGLGEREGVAAFGEERGALLRDWLLHPADPHPVGHEGVDGASPFLLLCDHAGHDIPASLSAFGVSDTDLARHIGHDIGALEVSRRVSRRLDAELIYQRYSRLVIDCNRAPHLGSAFPVLVDGTEVPGNVGLSAGDAARRVAEIFHPYHARIITALETRALRGQRSVLIAVHSFTPVHGDFAGERPWHVGVLFNRDRRLADPLIALLREEPGIIVGVNQPYVVDDEADYAIPVHGERHGRVHVEIEIRQDFIATAEGQARWTDILARVLPGALERLDRNPAVAG